MYTGFVRFENDIIACNCTPHPIRFQDGDMVREVEPSGYTLRASPIEEQVSEKGAIPVLVITKFAPSDEGTKDLESLERREILPIGSIISAQAWPGRVYGLVSVEGYERKPPAERLYRSDKFNIFGGLRETKSFGLNCPDPYDYATYKAMVKFANPQAEVKTEQFYVTITR